MGINLFILDERFLLLLLFLMLLLLFFIKWWFPPTLKHLMVLNKVIKITAFIINIVIVSKIIMLIIISYFIITKIITITIFVIFITMSIISISIIIIIGSIVLLLFTFSIFISFHFILFYSLLAARLAVVLAAGKWSMKQRTNESRGKTTQFCNDKPVGMLPPRVSKCSGPIGWMD